MAIEELLDRLFLLKPQVVPTPPIPQGLYHYTRESGEDAYEPGTYTRFHLRVDPDGYGVLLANATTAARLNPPGIVIAKGLLEDLEEREIYEQLKRSFRGTSEPQMREDLESLAALIANLVAPGDNYPIINFEDAAISPYEGRLMAPLQADVPLSEPKHIHPILNRLLQAAVPHVKFLVPANFDPGHLVRAVERAEDLGMIAGARVRASDLIQEPLLRDLALAGVDYITIPIASADATFHDGIWGSGDLKAAQGLFSQLQELEVAPVAEQLLIENSLATMDSSLEMILDSGITNIEYFAIAAPDEMSDQLRNKSLQASAMPQTADLVEELANRLQVRFIWMPPVMREPSLALNRQICEGPRTSGDVSIRVEANGDVVPPRGPYRSAGNLLTDEWSDIWNDNAFLKYRERVEQPTRCDDCPDLAICAVDCPRKMAGWSQGYGANKL